MSSNYPVRFTDLINELIRSRKEIDLVVVSNSGEWYEYTGVFTALKDDYVVFDTTDKSNASTSMIFPHDGPLAIGALAIRP